MFSNLKLRGLLLSLTFLFVFGGSSIVLAGPSPEPYMPDKTFETEYSLDDLRVKTFRPKPDYQYDIGCFEEDWDKVSKTGTNKMGYPYIINDLKRMCSVANFGSKAEIEITKNGKTIIVGEKDKINEGAFKGTYKHDYIELYDKRKTIGFLVAVTYTNSASCWPHCHSGYLINPDTLEILRIGNYLNIVNFEDTFVVRSGGELFFLSCKAGACKEYFFYESYFDKMSKKYLKTLKTSDSQSVQGLDQKQKSIEYFKKERNKRIKEFKNERKKMIPKEQPVIDLDIKAPYQISSLR